MEKCTNHHILLESNEIVCFSNATLGSISLDFFNPLQGLQSLPTIESAFPGVVIPRLPLQIPVSNLFLLPLKLLVTFL